MLPIALAQSCYKLIVTKYQSLNAEQKLWTTSSNQPLCVFAAKRL